MGTIKRLNHIFREDGKTIITAFDHGVNSGPMAGIADLGAALKQVIDAGTDAAILNIGMARKHEKLLGRTGLIVRADFPCTDYARGSHDSILCVAVEEAVKVGADAVLFNGGPDISGEDIGLERCMISIISRLRRECEKYGMPLIAEMVPGGFNPPAEYINLDSLKLAARVAAEAGADMLKMPYRSGPDGRNYEEVVNGCEGLPIVVLGGAKTNSQEQFFANIDDALKCGAKGVAIGRNIWGHAHPDRVIGLLNGLIHEGEDLKTAMTHLG